MVCDCFSAEIVVSAEYEAGDFLSAGSVMRVMIGCALILSWKALRGCGDGCGD